MHIDIYIYICVFVTCSDATEHGRCAANAQLAVIF